MLPSLNVSKKDRKYKLLAKIFKHFDSDFAVKIYARNGIKNINMFIICIKIVFTGLFFDYPVTKVIDEVNINNKLKKFLGIEKEVPTSAQVFEYMSRYSDVQFSNIVNSLLNRLNKPSRRSMKKYLIDSTAVECDINHIKQYISPERLEKLNLKWGYSTTKGHFIGFKVSVVLNEETLCPVSILIHPGAPNDSKLFEPILKELKRRHIIKNKDILMFDRGYYSYKNYLIGINEYKIIPMIFPKSYFKIEKLNNLISYPLEVFNKIKNSDIKKQLFKSIKKILLKMLSNWKDYKPIRGKIEDFFKITKDAFGLDKLHKYTDKSVNKTVYFTILLTAIAVQSGYNTKTKMQQLAEGILEQNPRKKYKDKKKKDKQKTNKKEKVPFESQQTLPFKILKEEQYTLLHFS